MAENEKIIVQLASPERLFTRCYHDFLDSKLLNSNEKFMFLVLKRFIDVKADNGEVFPTVDTLCSITGWKNQKVTIVIKSLVKKGIVKKIQRGLTKPNIYVLADYRSMWESETLEELKAVADNQGVKPLTPEQHIAELKKMGYIVEIKEKGLVSNTDQSEEASTHTFMQPDNISSSVCHNNITKSVKSQEETVERYSMEDIRELFDCDYLISDNPSKGEIISSVISILHNAMNTTKPTIRINGENKPSMAVIGKLMKLTSLDIDYVIWKYQEQTGRIKNPEAYLLTMLYKAKEQSSLDIANKVQHDMSKNQEDIDS